MLFRVRHRALGGFIDCRLMVGEPGTTGFAIITHMLIKREQFEEFKRACPGIEFAEDTHQLGSRK